MELGAGSAESKALLELYGSSLRMLIFLLHDAFDLGIVLIRNLNLVREAPSSWPSVVCHGVATLAHGATAAVF